VSPEEAAHIAAIERSPDDDAAIRAYSELLSATGNASFDPKAKPKARLGALASFGASVKVEKWRHGFVDHLRVIADDEKHARKIVDTIAATPSTRFVRTLEVLILGKRRSYAELDARLVELGALRTLATLVFGKPGDHAFSSALLAAFPRVGATPRKSWDEVAAAIRAIRGAGPAFATELAFRATLPITNAELVRGLAAEIDRKQDLGLCVRLVEDLSTVQLADLSAALISAWTSHGEEAAGAWVYDMAARFGGAESARLIGRRIAAISHGRAEHGLDTLARMSCPLAILEQFEASRLWTARGEAAELALERRATNAGLRREQVPTLLAQIGSEPRCDGDALARFLEIDARVVEYLMVTGWSAPLSTVRAWFRGDRAAGLVWRTSSASTHAVTQFTLDDDRTISHDGNMVILAPDDHVSLVHVEDPDARDLSAWRTWQSTRGVRFEQLARTAPLHGSMDALQKLQREYGSDIEALRARGYRNGGLKTDDTHEELRFVKTHRYRGEPYTVTISMVGEPIRVSRALPPVVRFEVARDLAARS
jgi:hypothetical protein